MASQFVNIWAPLINFIIFCVLAVIFFRGPLGRLTLGRKSRFVDAREEAQKSKFEVEAKLASVAEEYDALDSIILQIKKDAEAEADKECKKIIETAKNAAESLTNDVARVAETELTLARNQLRSAILAETTKAVGNKIREEFNADRAREFVSKQTDRLNSLTH